MKLQYKNNQWEDENGVPIAPNDQEKVKILMQIEEVKRYGISKDFDYKWQPEIGKLYDSDLEFESGELASCKIAGCKSNGDQFNCIGEGCGWNPLKVWVLKEKAKEINKDSTPEEMSDYVMSKLKLSDYRTVTDKVQVEEKRKYPYINDLKLVNEIIADLKNAMIHGTTLAANLRFDDEELTPLMKVEGDNLKLQSRIAELEKLLQIEKDRLILCNDSHKILLNKFKELDGIDKKDE